MHFNGHKEAREGTKTYAGKIICDIGDCSDFFASFRAFLWPFILSEIGG
jgi:hypothetical protein